LLKVHPDTAIVSVERPRARPLSPNLDDTADDYLDPVMSGGSVKSPTLDRVKSEMDVGETLADIADTNFFDSAKDLSDDLYAPDLF
jgi:hypothetical protein